MVRSRVGGQAARRRVPERPERLAAEAERAEVVRRRVDAAVRMAGRASAAMLARAGQAARAARARAGREQERVARAAKLARALAELVASRAPEVQAREWAEAARVSLASVEAARVSVAWVET